MSQGSWLLLYLSRTPEAGVDEHLTAVGRDDAARGTGTNGTVSV